MIKNIILIQPLKIKMKNLFHLLKKIILIKILKEKTY